MGFLERAIRRGVSDAVEQYRRLLLEGGFREAGQEIFWSQRPFRHLSDSITERMKRQ